MNIGNGDSSQKARKKIQNHDFSGFVTFKLKAIITKGNHI